MKTQKEVRNYALAAADWIYVWGANGEIYTPELANKLYRKYGSATYSKSYYDEKLKTGAGKMAADCSGFMMPLSGYDSTAQGYYDACKQKGMISSIPKDKVCLVFKHNKSGIVNHIGIYLGDGTVAEMASSKTNYLHRSLGAADWSHWGIPKWIDYSVNEPEKNVKEGWKRAADGKHWWYQNADGSYPAMCWKLIKHHWYLFGASGYMLTGWVQWDGEKTGAGDWYYLEESGEFQGACWHGKSDGSGGLERWYVS